MMEEENFINKKIVDTSDSNVSNEIDDKEVLKIGHENSTLSSNIDDVVNDNDSPKGVATTSTSNLISTSNDINETEDVVEVEGVVEIAEEVKIENALSGN